jgi:hypothetical protein
VTAEPTYVLFRADRLDPAVEVMDSLTEAHAGWVNFQPAVDVDDVPRIGAGIFALFAGKGPDVPLATWMPPTGPKRGRPEPPRIGLQHGTGTKAKKRLAEAGHPIPDGWVVQQDYVKKGLVVAVPPQVSHADVLAWLIGAARALSNVPLAGEWRAEVYRV